MSFAQQAYAGIRFLLLIATTGLAFELRSTRIAAAASLLFEDTQVQASYPQVKGSPSWSLQAVVVRLDDGQRHPLAAFIDGTPEFSPRPMLYVARELARRGWTTVAVVRPGFGGSEGKEPPPLCEGYVMQANFASQALRETLRVMGQKPYIDPAVTMVIGHSTGGLGAVATTVKPPANLAAAINFAGNNGSQYLKGKLDTVCNSTEVVNAFATFGRSSRIPMLWIYAQNDHHMGPALAQSYFKAFTNGGGMADFEMAPPLGEDGHGLYSMRDGAEVWTPYLDKFLADHHLAFVTPSLTISVADVAPPDGLGASGRAGFAAYLAAMPHKAFAMSSSHWASASLRDSTDMAATQAMSNCKGTDADPCKIVMIDDQRAH
jgi:dienelactone hydrolase